jgi:protein TonB
MNAPPPRKTAAIVSLALGCAGLFSGGLCGLGALLGLLLGGAALMRRSEGREIAWAGIVTNLVGLLTIVPFAILLFVLQQSHALPDLPIGENELPEPYTSPFTAPEAPMPPPPPPPATYATPRRVAETERGTAPSGGVEPVRIGGTIREPKKLKHVNPVYPAIARQARVQGVVILEATLDPSGKVAKVRVLRGIPLLDQAAVEAVQQWVYTPTLLNGVPVPVIMTITVNFTLQ